VTEDVRRVAEAPPLTASDRLDSWKEIAAYLKRDSTTVRRWEKREGLPVHRHRHDRRESVYAYRQELDLWWSERSNHLVGNVPEDSPKVRRWTRGAIAVTAVVFALSAAASALWFMSRNGRAPLERRTVRLAFQPVEQTGDFALSPDGRLLAFVSGAEEEARLWIRSLDDVEPRLLSGTEGAETVFWSPDSRFIGFGAGGKLKKIPVSGGAVQVLCDARAVIGGTWNRDDVIVFTPSNRTPLYRVSASGGQPVAVTSLDASQGHNTHRWPYFLPDGHHFIYLARSAHSEQSGIYLGSLESLSGTRIITAESRMAYAAPGYLIFARPRELLAQPFDLRTKRVSGEPLQILDDVLYNRDDSYGAFSVSDHGELAYQTSAAVPRSALVWFDRKGNRIAGTATLQDAEEPSISADGTRVVVSRWAGTSKDIWLLDLTKGSSRVTSTAATNLMPIWSPDATSILFASSRDGPSDLYLTDAAGTATPQLLVRSGLVKHPTDWSRTAGVIVYESNDPKTSWDLWTIPVGGGTPSPYLQTHFSEGHGRLSPDGRWMAYVSNESGTREVFIRPYPASSGKVKVSTSGGMQPRWRRDGSELFYLTLDARLMSVAVQGGSSLRTATPKALFPTPVSQNGEWAYDPTPDGQRFVFSVPMGDSQPAPIMIVLNWAQGRVQ
jgi:Tol biopolymer transport system component